MSSGEPGLPGQSRAEWKAHWPVVLAACGGVALSTMNTYSMGVFMHPLEQQFGWSRAAITSGQAMAGVATVALAPFMGSVIDRLGPRRIGLAGAALHCTLTSSLALTGPSIHSWQGVWVLLALMNVMILPNVWAAAVSSVFSAGRGLALAVTLCGSGIGSMVTPVLAVHLIDWFGWRLAYPALAWSWGLVVIPLLFLFFRGARDHGGSAGPQGVPRAASVADKGGALATLLTARFAKLALATLLIATVVVPLGVTLVPILSAGGLTRTKAAEIAALMGLASITGRLTIGYLLDHVAARVLAAVAVCIPIVACALLIGAPGSVLAATAAVIATGLALGAELDIVAYLASRHFSLGRFGLVFGTLTGLVTLGGGGVGPLALNSVFDHLHSYIPALWVAMPMCLASSLLFLSLGAYPVPAVDTKP